MKTVTGIVISAEPISLSKAATLLSGFASSENGATQAVSAYLRRASAAFTELKSIHREIKSSSIKATKSKSDKKHDYNPTGEFDELSGAKGIDDLVENGAKIGFRKSETLSEVESINEKKKKKSKKKKDEEVVDDKVKEKFEDEQQRNEEGKEEKKKRKSKKNKEEEVVDEKVKEKLDDEQQRNDERKEKKKKKRKSDGEMVSEERKSKKKRKSKEIDG